MRILICGFTYAPHVYGQATFTHELAEGLAARGHEVMVLAPRVPGCEQSDACDSAAVVRTPALSLEPLQEGLYLSLKCRQIARRVLATFRPDIVHVQDASPLCRAVVRAARKRGIPIVGTHHPGPEITGPLLKTTNPTLKKACSYLGWRYVLQHLARLDLVTVPSQTSVRMLEAQELRTPVVRVPCSTDLSAFHPQVTLDRAALRQRYGLDPDGILVLYAGRLDVEKRVDVLIRALAALQHPDVQLAIAGGGSQEAALRQLARELGVGEQVVFLGQVSRAEMPALLEGSDIFAMPGDAESFSIATLEAMACGKPVLAAKAAALTELVTHLKTGYLFRPGDAEDAADGLRELIHQRPQWASMGALAIGKAQQFSPQHTIQALERIYAGLVQPRPIPASRRTPLHPRLGRHLAWARSHPILVLVIALLLLTLSLALVYDEIQALPRLNLGDLSLIHIRESRSLLVIAPHPDDEILAAGGLLQAALANGARVHIVVVTNGDGQLIGPLALPRDSTLAGSNTYVRLGTQRQRETLTALAYLGLDASAIDFLGYPDGKIETLWNSAWFAPRPIRGPLTGAARSPYAHTFNIEATYEGSSLLNDLLDILNDVAPDTVFVPHPEDTHTDHRGVSAFSQLAIALYSARSGAYPTVLGYLIHYRGYPLPRGIQFDQPILPPTSLSRDREGWVTYLLESEERQRKYAALKLFVTQQRLSGAYLSSFARANEVFFKLPPIELNTLDYAAQDTLREGFRPEATLLEPERETFSRYLTASGDLVAWHALRLPNQVCFGAETRGPYSEAILYRILAKLPDGTTLRVHSTDDAFVRFAGSFGACFNLEALGDPEVIGFSAETWNGLLLDRTAWRFFIIAARGPD